MASSAAGDSRFIRECLSGEKDVVLGIRRFFSANCLLLTLSSACEAKRRERAALALRAIYNGLTHLTTFFFIVALPLACIHRAPAQSLIAIVTPKTFVRLNKLERARQTRPETSSSAPLNQCNYELMYS